MVKRRSSRPERARKLTQEDFDRVLAMAKDAEQALLVRRDAMVILRRSCQASARLLDGAVGRVRENLVQRGQFTPEVATEFEGLAQLVSALASIGDGQVVPWLLDPVPLTEEGANAAPAGG